MSELDLDAPGEAFCRACPDHEACATGWPCWKVREGLSIMSDDHEKCRAGLALTKEALGHAILSDADARSKLDTLRQALTDQERDTDFFVKDRDQLARRLAAVEELHQPVYVPSIEGTSLTEFTRCSCTPGLLYDECPTAAAIEDL